MWTFICLVVLALQLNIPDVSAIESTGYILWNGQAKPTACGAAEFWDSASLTCRACSLAWSEDDDTATLSAAVPDVSVTDVYGNALGCKCPRGYVQSTQDCSASSDTDGSCEAFTCAQCSDTGVTDDNTDDSLTSYYDNSACVMCGNSTGATAGAANPINTDSTSAWYLTCQCPQSAGTNGYQILVEEDAGGNKKPTLECVDCPVGTGVIAVATSLAGRSYSADINNCQSCPDINMEMTFDSSGAPSCSCKSGYSQAGVSDVGELYCVLTTIGSTFVSSAASAAETGIFIDASTSATSVDSLVVQHYFPGAATGCMHYRDGTPEAQFACQTLANLCVLNHYTSSPACNALDSVYADRGTNVINNVETWYAGVPWLSYKSDEIDVVCLDEQIDDLMTFNEKEMKFWVSKFSINGTWHGYEELGTTLSYCTQEAPHSGGGGGTSSSTKWQVFGASGTNSWNCDLTTLNDQDQYFYDLYYEDRSGDLYPVPVRFTQYSDGGAFPNQEFPQELCDITDILFRRFFLFDRFAGVTGVSADDSVSTLNAPAYIRFAQRMTLEVRVQHDNPTRMYAPVMTIVYDGREMASGDTTVGYKFTMRYTQDMGDFYVILDAFFIATSTIFGLLCLMRGFNYNARNSRPIIDASQVFTGYAVGLNSRTLREGLAVILNSWVIMFFPFTCVLCWYFFVFFKMQAQVSVLLPPQVDVYSTDSPYYIFTTVLHILTFFQLYHIANLIYKQCNADIFFLDWEQKKKGSQGGKSVSVWRSIMAANEWNEMLTMRRTNIVFTLFWIGFFLLGDGLHLEYNATQQPDLADKGEGDLNIILRFANTTWWWLILSLVQVVWKWLIWERYYDEPPEQKFVDMCTVAKVSVLVLLEPYFGYYLHCRSPHQFADGSMAELVEMLHQEEAGLTIDRALEGAPADVQSFQLFVSSEWRIYFDKIYQHFGANDAAKGGICSNLFGRCCGSAKRGNGGGTEVAEGQTKALLELTSFMGDFVDNNFGRVGLRRQIVMPSYSSVLFRNPPPMAMGEQPCTMVPDKTWEFTSVMFLGCELDFLCFNILCYSIFDLWFNDTITSILLTYLFDSMLCLIRGNFGRSILARKTMMDERFLL